MAILARSQRLKKELGLVGAFAIATGATLSSGFFLLPGLAAAQVGPALVVSYMLAALALLPAAVSMVELATAMPRAGGTYFFLDRSMGPLVGTVGGLGTWLVLILKTAFALVGMGAYLQLIDPRLPMTPVAVVLAVAFGGINLLGARKAVYLQISLVFALLALIAWFSGSGLQVLKAEHFDGFFQVGLDPLLGTAGMVYISYVGVTTKVASIAEEIKDPGRNLPIAVFVSLATAVVIYLVGTVVMVGTLAPQALANDLTPAASSARAIAGRWGEAVMAGAALLAFASVANAGILSASRFPLALSRDHLVPPVVRKLSHRQIPYVAVCATVGVILLVLLLLDPIKIAKLGGAFQLLLFALICVAVIVMRESRIESYDPAFRSPLYPYVQIAGIVMPLLLLSDMGWLPVLFSCGMVLAGVAWFYHYARGKVRRVGAIYHVFHRLGGRRFPGLDTEFRVILKERGLRSDDPFEQLITEALFFEVPPGMQFLEVTQRSAELIAGRLPERVEVIVKQFLDGTAVGATPCSKGAALPHFRHPEVDGSLLCIARSVNGIDVDPEDPVWGGHAPEQPIHAVFFLVSSEADPALHLRILAEVAEKVENEGFMDQWLRARDELRLKELLLRDRHFLGITLSPEQGTDGLVGQSVRDVDFGQCLVALISREGKTLIPHGTTELQEHDRLTILGQADDIKQLRARLAAGTLGRG